MAYNVLSRMTWKEREAYRAKRKVEIAAEKARKTAKAMTCQCCGRQIFAQSGRIAHHGYERPGYGWQTASCMGALYQPFEVDRARLADLITGLEHALQETRDNFDKVQREAVKLGVSIEIDTPEYKDEWGYKHTKKSETQFFSRKQYDALKEQGAEEVRAYLDSVTATPVMERNKTVQPLTIQMYFNNRSYDDIKAAALREIQGRVDALRSDLKLSQDRFDSWKQTHTHFNPVDKFWVAVK